MSIRKVINEFIDNKKLQASVPMNASDQILAEIKERWKKDIEFWEEEGETAIENITCPAKDIRYLLNRLDAAERAARQLAEINQKLLKEKA